MLAKHPIHDCVAINPGLLAFLDVFLDRRNDPRLITWAELSRAHRETSVQCACNYRLELIKINCIGVQVVERSLVHRLQSGLVAKKTN